MIRTGIFGGTFNPPHRGHIYIAREAMKQAGLDRMIFLPCGNPYHKEQRDIADAKHRYEMTLLAIKDEADFEICDIEVKSENPGYTAVTLNRLKEIMPDEQLCFLVGGDSLVDMEGWYHPSEIFDNAEVLVAKRGGMNGELIDRTVSRYRREYGAEIRVIELSPVEISSSEIRERIRQDCGLADMLSPYVMEYIRKFNLYKDEK